METALYILHIVVCLAMLPIILLQSGKGGGVSATFGGGGSGSVFGSRGASTFLTKMTTGAAVLFMLTSLGLSYISSQSKSVVADVPEPAKEATVGEVPGAEEGTVPAPVAPVEAPAEPAAPEGE